MSSFKKCFITPSVSPFEEKNNVALSNQILTSWSQVPCNETNSILQAILKKVDDIYSNQQSIIWVKNTPYKIKLEDKNNKNIVLQQLCLNVTFKNNGKMVYEVVNKRMVKLVI